MYKISFTNTYIKHLQKLTKNEQKQVARKLSMLANNPAYPSLRTKLVKGQNGIWESSVNMDIRILWKYKGKTIIVTLDVGHHDIFNTF